MVWYENYGWKSNPFTIDPVPDTFIIEDIHSKVVESIYSGDVLNLYGETGTGKTSLLRMLEKNLKGEFVPVFIDPLDLPQYAPADASSRQYEGFLNKLKKDALRNPLSILRKLLGSTLLENLKATYRKKRLVLLIDEAKDISDPLIPSYFRSIKNSGANCAIVLTSIDPLSKFEVFKDSLRFVRVKYLQMRRISLSEAKLMLTKRIESVGGKGIRPFDDRTLKYLVEISDYVPIAILGNAEDVLKYVSSNGNPNEVGMEDISSAVIESRPKATGKAEEPAEEKAGEKSVETGQKARREGKTETEKTQAPKESEMLFKNLTPTQRKIVDALRKSDMTAEELCRELGVNYGVVFPELYRLMLIRDADRMKRKGIKKPILSKTKEKPYRYMLDTAWRLGSVKE